MATAGERRFPCLDGHVYAGCVGLAECCAERCWNGRRLHPAEEGVHADVYDQPLKIERYVASDCPNCAHAVDLQVGGGLRSAGGRLIARWTICELGLWAGPASLYSLLNHRAPVKHAGRCAQFVDTPPERMRPELARLRAADRTRAGARRAKARGAKAAA
ncbi:MAG: hypothetical protein ACHQ7M_11450 [Chloroflexota bacterium]